MNWNKTLTIASNQIRNGDMWTPEIIKLAAKASIDPVFCLDNFVWMDADEGIIQFNIGHAEGEEFYYQYEIILHVYNGENILILKNRRAGLSWIASFVSWHGVNFTPGWNALLVSRTEKEAISLLKKPKFIHDNLAFKDSEDIALATPASFLKNPVVTNNQRMFGIGHTNSLGEVTAISTLTSLTTTKHSGRGEKSKFVFVDEVQFIDNQDEVFGSVLTTGARAGQWMMGSNAGDAGTQFHMLCMKGKTGDNSTYWYREVWPWEVGFTEEDIERVTEALPEDVIKQEWYLTFKQGGNAVFNETHLAMCYKPPHAYPEIADALIQYDLKVKHSRGTFYYYSGVDSAVGKVNRKSKDKDYNCFIALTSDCIQAFAHYDKQPLSEWAGQDVQQGGIMVSMPGTVSNLHKEWPGLATIEEEGPGYTVISRHQLPDDGFSDRRLLSMKQKIKSRIIKNLIIAIESHSIIITDEKTYQQLLMYRYGETPDTYEAGAGSNDDGVMALAMAWDGLLSEGGYEYSFGKPVEDLQRIEISEKAKKDMDLEKAGIAPVLSMRAGVRSSKYMPSLFDDLPPIMKDDLLRMKRVSDL